MLGLYLANVLGAWAAASPSRAVKAAVTSIMLPLAVANIETDNGKRIEDTEGGDRQLIAL